MASRRRSSGLDRSSHAIRLEGASRIVNNFVTGRRGSSDPAHEPEIVYPFLIVSVFL